MSNISSNISTRDGHAIYFTDGGYPYTILNADFNNELHYHLRECHVIKQLHDEAVKVVKIVNGKIWKVIKPKNNSYSRAVEIMESFCASD